MKRVEGLHKRPETPENRRFLSMRAPGREGSVHTTHGIGGGAAAVAQSLTVGLLIHADGVCWPGRGVCNVQRGCKVSGRWRATRVGSSLSLARIQSHLTFCSRRPSWSRSSVYGPRTMRPMAPPSALGRPPAHGCPMSGVGAAVGRPACAANPWRPGRAFAGRLATTQEQRPRPCNLCWHLVRPSRRLNAVEGDGLALALVLRALALPRTARPGRA